MSNENQFYPRIIIIEYFDTLLKQLREEIELAYSADDELPQSDIDTLKTVQKQLIDEINRLKQVNLRNYECNSRVFLQNLHRIRQDTSIIEEKKINIIYRLLFSSGYAFFIDSNKNTQIKRLVVLDCFPSNNNIFDQSKNGYEKYYTELNEVSIFLFARSSTILL
jgi:hypothetical protein